MLLNLEMRIYDNIIQEKSSVKAYSWYNRESFLINYYFLVISSSPVGATHPQSPGLTPPDDRSKLYQSQA